jgi:hypothetical protein
MSPNKLNKEMKIGEQITGLLRLLHRELIMDIHDET